MTEYNITPTVDQTQEFIEIAYDFANPLDLVREAISNSFDAKASEIKISFETEQIAGETTSVIHLHDNGEGMDERSLQSFFDLGNSTRRGDCSTIGEKGHGTKVFFNSKKLLVDTQKNGVRLVAELDSPFSKLHDRKIPIASVHRTKANPESSGTSITIYGYNNNRRERFTQGRLRDFIFWFTKFGSIEKQFGRSDLSDTKLYLKGLDADAYEVLSFGHPFPEESLSASDLFDKWMVLAPHYYCRRIVRSGSLPNLPEIRFNAVFSVEGKKVKYDSNPMLRRPGYAAPEGAYTFQDRYGLWLCKDFMPIQRKNEWITTKGTEFTKLHAFFNCQALKLTANRGSIDNTSAEVLQDIEYVVREMYREISESDEWVQLTYLEEEADVYNTTEKEKKNFQFRIERANSSKIADLDGITLIEPKRESGVYSLVVQLSVHRPELFPFSIVDYDTHEGIDVIVKANDKISVRGSHLYYVEFKYLLSSSFNHSFENLYSIVCWDTDLKHGDVVKDINREERKLAICPPETQSDYTRYFLENPRRAHRIEVFVLKSYLPERLGITFRPRTGADIH